MRGWNDLPAEMRQEVVKKLNIFDRNSLRNCSRFDRQVVDSLKYFLPRVDFYEDFCDCYEYTLDIYLGIDECFRLIFDMKNEKTAVSLYSPKVTKTTKLKPAPAKFMNPKNVNLVKKKSNLDKLGAAALAFKSILMHPNIHIDTLDWRLLQDETEELVKILAPEDTISCLKLRTIDRADELISRFRVEGPRALYEDFEMTDYMFKMASRLGDLNKYTPICVVRCKPRIHDSYNFSMVSDECRKSLSNISVKCRFYRIFSMSSECERTSDDHFYSAICLIRSKYVNVEKLFDMFESETERVNDDILVKRLWSPNRTKETRVHLTPCGIWSCEITSDNESYVQDILKNNKCAFGAICPRCAPPFDNWYVRGCALRIKWAREWGAQRRKDLEWEEQSWWYRMFCFYRY